MGGFSDGIFVQMESSFYFLMKKGVGSSVLEFEGPLQMERSFFSRAPFELFFFFLIFWISN